MDIANGVALVALVAVLTAVVAGILLRHDVDLVVESRESFVFGPEVCQLKAAEVAEAKGRS